MYKIRMHLMGFAEIYTYLTDKTVLRTNYLGDKIIFSESKIKSVLMIVSSISTHSDFIDTGLMRFYLFNA